MGLEPSKFLNRRIGLTNTLIEFKNVYKFFGETKALDNVSFKVNENEFMTLLGPSGCGKTTTLRIMGGFEDIERGTVCFDGEDLTKIPAHKRQINTVFQKYALFPHLNVYENIAFGLRVKKVSGSAINDKVEKMLKLINLDGFDKRHVNSLSGGQQQRVAIARALVNEPKVLLLDEPLGALDLKLRKGMQTELKNIQKHLGITFIYVTHDQEEALTMSDKIIVMKDGVIQQAGTPEDIYNEPVNSFVADFIGESNILDGTMVKDRLVEFAGRRFDCVDVDFGEDTPVDVVIRPEDLSIVPAADGQIAGTVDSVTFKGVHFEIRITSGDYAWTVHSTRAPSVGDTVGLTVDPFDIQIMHKVDR
jgi:spermidine/putrescine transport system ATP-binding protein